MVAAACVNKSQLRNEKQRRVWAESLGRCGPKSQTDDGDRLRAKGVPCLAAWPQLRSTGDRLVLELGVTEGLASGQSRAKTLLWISDVSA